MLRKLKNKSWIIRRRAVFYIFIALAVVVASIVLVMISSLVKADRLMKITGESIPPYATNRFSSFRSVSFTSGGGQISLKGWLIETRTTPPRATLIIVHQQRGNRLPYGLATTSLYSQLTKAGFQILAFDLRHSGESKGEMSSFGYAEAEDVRMALEWTIKNTSNVPIVLYGFGSGTTAIFRMMDQLHQEISDSDVDEATEQKDSASKSTLTATDIRKRISAIIVDSPARDSDDFIKAAIQEEGNKLFFWLKNTTPYAIRLSLGNSEQTDHFAKFTTLTLPVMIFVHEKDSILPDAAYRPMIEERIRLHPAWTFLYESEGTGHLTSYEENPDAYTEALLEFLRKWFPATN
ncbi:MAG TPA: alpha/beta hydrolase [Clostridiaceae bacterium]|nr:alpha/beta hydrolase [Clostridiaceae bacterium]